MRRPRDITEVVCAALAALRRGAPLPPAALADPGNSYHEVNFRVSFDPMWKGRTPDKGRVSLHLYPTWTGPGRRDPVKAPAGVAVCEAYIVLESVPGHPALAIVRRPGGRRPRVSFIGPAEDSRMTARQLRMLALFTALAAVCAEPGTWASAARSGLTVALDIG